MLVKPAPGCAIRAPGTMKLVPDDGLEIDPTVPFWARAIGDGDLVEAEPEPAPEKVTGEGDPAHDAPHESDLAEAPPPPPTTPAVEAPNPEHAGDGAISHPEGDA